MAFCQNCGAEVTGRFCGKCGSASGYDPAAPSASAGAAYTEPPPGPAYQAPPPAQSGGMSVNVASALCYVLGLVTGIIFLVLEPYNRNRVERFHAFQSIFMHLAVIVIYMVLFPVIGIVSGGLAFMLSPIIGLVVIGLWLYMMYTAYQNQKVVLPIIGPIAEKQA
jgi:uncharacterized membrane protein